MTTVLALVFAVASAASPAKASASSAPARKDKGAQTLYDAYPDVEKKIEFNGETRYLIGFDTKTGEAVYGSKHAVKNMLKGVSKDGPDVKTLRSYPEVPKAIEDEVGVMVVPPPDPGCSHPTDNLYDDRTYGKPGITVSYYYALSVWWTADCLSGGKVISQSSSAQYQVTCGSATATSSEAKLNDYSTRSLGNYTFNLTCLTSNFTRWITGTTDGYGITFQNSQASEAL